MDPGAQGSSDGFALSNGQDDEYPDGDTVPIIEAFRLAEHIVGTGSRPADEPSRDLARLCLLLSCGVFLRLLELVSRNHRSVVGGYPGESQAGRPEEDAHDRADLRPVHPPCSSTSHAVPPDRSGSVADARRLRSSCPLLLARVRDGRTPYRGARGEGAVGSTSHSSIAGHVRRPARAATTVEARVMTAAKATAARVRAAG